MQQTISSVPFSEPHSTVVHGDKNKNKILYSLKIITTDRQRFAFNFNLL